MIKNRSLQGDTKGLNAFANAAGANQAVSANGTVSGRIIDMAGFDALQFYLNSGTITDGVHTLKLQDGDLANGSDMADVDSTQVFAFGTNFNGAADSNLNKRFGYNANKRYVRLQIVSTGVTTGGTFSGVALRANPKHSPIAPD